MKRSKLLIFFLLLLLGSGLIFSLTILSRSRSRSEKEKASVIFVGPKKEASTFEKASKSARQFYDLFNRALQASNSGDNEIAIKLLNESLSYVALGPEKAMVYRKLSEIYNAQGNLEKELFYVEQLPKYSMNAQLNEEANRRAEELRRLLAGKEETG